MPINRLTAPLIRAVSHWRSRHQIRTAHTNFEGDIVKDSVAGVRVTRITPHTTAAAEFSGGPAKESGKPFIVYVHGGAFLVGGPVDPIVLALAAGTGLPAVSVQYDLIPEQRYPVALDQVTAVWRALTSNWSGSAMLVAQSAGGNLALALLSRIVSGLPGDAGLVHPAGVVLFSPWSDLMPPGSRESSRMVNEGLDARIRWNGMLDRAASLYAGAESTSTPAVSPINGRFKGLRAPVLLTTASLDLFAPDCERLAEVLRRDGVTVTLDSTPGLWHVYQTEPELPETAASFDLATRFITDALGRPQQR
ncbi:alpha/beta hydrolase fold domain-containing protein [Mycobacterium aquaticum]|uniref:alpha/beta hydrolase fold domain-containing protein n=1 Tax=Mycobacterium aquaticum TaxID=1927124 RepID=UPI001301C027|nr:alpha/beta hydrolase fold domain-containing protein [Mycobacterium aquaticum]